MIGDGIVTWRACVVWHNAKIVKYTLIALMVANIGNESSRIHFIMLYTKYIQALNIASSVITQSNFDDSFKDRFIDASNFTSFAINLFATSMIGLKL